MARRGGRAQARAGSWARVAWVASLLALTACDGCRRRDPAGGDAGEAALGADGATPADGASTREVVDASGPDTGGGGDTSAEVVDDAGTVRGCVYVFGDDDELDEDLSPERLAARELAAKQREERERSLPPATLEGDVGEVIAHHAMNGTEIPFFALTFDEPACFHRSPEPQYDVHLRFKGLSERAERAKLRAYAGKRVRVRGRASRAPATAWWPRPIVFEAESIDVLPKKKGAPGGGG